MSVQLQENTNFWWFPRRPLRKHQLSEINRSRKCPLKQYVCAVLVFECEMLKNIFGILIVLFSNIYFLTKMDAFIAEKIW